MILYFCLLFTLIPVKLLADEELRMPNFLYISTIYRHFMLAEGSESNPLNLTETRPPTLVVGPPEVAIEVERILTLSPFLRGKVKRVIVGETESTYDVAESFTEYKFGNRDVWDFVWGTWNGSEITIAPNITPCQTMRTLYHEFGHAAGMDHGDELDMVEALACDKGN